MKESNKNNIECIVACETKDDKVKRQFEITVAGRVWPCCYYATELKKSSNSHVDLTDTVLDKLNEEDPDWNNAVVHGVENVTKHNLFWTYLWDEGFDSDNPPTVCSYFCGNK